MRGAKRRFVTSAVLVVGLLFAGAACGADAEHEDPRPPEERDKEPDPLNSKVFVDADEFADLADDGATILDTRELETYEEGHYPGAVQVDGGKPWKGEHGYLIARTDDDGALIGDVVEAQQLVRDLGVDNDRPVVIYGDARNSETGRLFWTLEYYGHGDVHLLRDTYDDLLDELEFEEETDTPEVEAGEFVVSFRDSVFATVEEVHDAIDSGDAILVDTRRESEWEGVEDRDDPRQGYIPEAIWYYWEEIFDEDDTLRDRDELEAEFEDKGLVKEDAVVIPYCQTGTRSSYIYAVLRWFGHEEAANYDGSWVEWSRDEDRPIEEPQNE